MKQTSKKKRLVLEKLAGFQESLIVKKAVNTLEYLPGQVMTIAAVQALIDNTDFEIEVVNKK